MPWDTFKQDHYNTVGGDGLDLSDSYNPYA